MGIDWSSVSSKSWQFLSDSIVYLLFDLTFPDLNHNFAYFVEAIWVFLALSCEAA